MPGPRGTSSPRRSTTAPGAKDLSLEELEQIYPDFGDGETHLDEAFAEHFGATLPDVVNAEQQFTIVASELDPTSDRIIEFLAESYDVPINAVFFRHFADGGHEYLARTWLLDPQQVEEKAARPSRRKLRALERPGLLRDPRVIPARDAEVEVEGRRQPLLDQPDVSAAWKQSAASEDSQVTEMVVPVEWLAARPVDQAFREKGLFASQVTATLTPSKPSSPHSESTRRPASSSNRPAEA